MVEKTVIVDMEESQASMKATNICMKTYFIKNRMGEVVTVTTLALYERKIHQDLLSGKACNRTKIRILLELGRCILWMRRNNNTSKNQLCLFNFISDPTDLYFLRIEEMDSRKGHATNGYNLWHRRLRDL